MKVLQDGAIKRLYEAPFDSTFHPLVQIIESQPIEGSRYSLIISDGTLSCKCIASPALGAKIQNDEIRTLHVGTINSYTKSIVRGSAFIVVNEFAPLFCPAEREGDPRDIDGGNNTRLQTSAPLPQVQSRVDTSRASSRSDMFTPIRALSTFNSDWTIKARVTKKCDVKEWNNARGSGKLFNVNLMDTLGDEISATFFNQGVEKFFPLLIENRVYTFSKGQVKLANKKFQTVACEYQLSFDKSSDILEAQDDGTIENIKFNLVTLDQLSEIAKRGGQNLIDLCAVVKEIGEVSEFTSKKGDPLKKRVLELVDHTNFTVELTLWNDEALNPVFSDVGGTPFVLLAKSLKVSDFNNISLATDRNASKLIFNPAGIKEADHMIQWRDLHYNPQGNMTALSVRSGGSNKPREYRTLRSINEEWSSLTDTSLTDFYTVRAHVNYVKCDDTTSLWYSSCEKCKKKMAKQDDMFHCDTCNQSSPTCVYRYVVTMKICDETDGLWASAFDDSFVQIVEMRAQELKELADRSEEEFKDKIATCVNQRFEFAIKAAVQDNGQGPRVKYNIVGVSQIDQKKLTKTLLQDLETMLSIK